MGQRLGQHFLISPHLARKIVEFAELPHHAAVLEIGPGHGALTRWLLTAGCRVLAVEADVRLARRLRRGFGEHPELYLVVGDILKLDWRELVQEHLQEIPVHVVSNLPYQISSPIVQKLMDHEDLWSTATLMFQREFAERIRASAGTSNYSALSVLAQVRWTVRTGFRVAPGSFAPPPRVESLVVRIEKRAELPNTFSGPRLTHWVRIGFRHRRKTLLNNLRRGTASEYVDRARAWLEAHGRPLTVRAQDLTPEDWVDLAAYLEGTTVSAPVRS